jgi:hypothetical protein
MLSNIQQANSEVTHTIPVIIYLQNKMIWKTMTEHASSDTVLGTIPHLPIESEEFFIRMMLRLNDTTYTYQTKTQLTLCSLPSGVTAMQCQAQNVKCQV